MQSRLPRSTPEAQGLASTALLNFLTEVEQNIHELHSFMLVRHGHVVAEGWWKPYAPELPHMLFSLSKSFTSTAIGLAVGEGRLSVEDKVISFFPDDLPATISPKLAAMRVHDLLAMATGHDVDATEKSTQASTWVKGFLAQPVEHEPGTHFVYNSAATYMLSAIIQKLTGMTLLEYLKPRLFEPLGIENPTWEQSPQGINTGGWGLNIRTEDIACFGQMYLQGGIWKGKRLIAEEWIKTATSKQVNNDSNQAVDWKQGYGYQFWRCQHNAYRGDGAFGQYCIVMPDQDAVIAITSGVGDMQAVLTAIWTHLLPAMKGTPMPDNSAAQSQLKGWLARLAFLPPQGKATSPMAATVSGKQYQIEAGAPNPDPRVPTLKTMTFDFAQAGCTITIRTDKDEQQFTCGYGTWQEGSLTLFPHSPKLISSGVWSSENTFTITQRFYETPFCHTLNCQFKGDDLSIDANVNVSFGPTKYVVTGHAEKQEVR